MSFWPFAQNKVGDATIDDAYLGGKGAGLLRMAKAGLPVPPGFVIPVDVCREIAEIKDPDTILSAYTLRAVEGINYFLTNQMGYTPLVSVRSGARVSMPGMMDTILNVGMTDETLPFWTQKLGHKAALDLYRRLIYQYGTTVKGINPERFKSMLKMVMASKYDSKPAKTEAEMSVTHLNKLIQQYLTVYKKYSLEEFPQTLEAQLKGSIGAVFRSWNSPRAFAYRIKNKIPHDWYTACVVQAMVFGNANEKSCSGVLFSRDPSTGAPGMMGEFLPNAQGEEVVSGTATPLPLIQLATWNPDVYNQLTEITGNMLEHTYKDMVDIEFTVESGKLYILQSRVGKRTASAGFKIAYDLVKEGVISKEEALNRLTIDQYQTLAVPAIDPAYKGKPIATGLAGSKGIAGGKIWFTAEKAQANPGGILVTKETNPDDYAGMLASAGILTQTGGITCHAALTARSLEKACVVGCTTMQMTDKYVVFGDAVAYNSYQFMEGAELTIDGSTGHVYAGAVPMIGGKVPAFVDEMVEWGAIGDEVFQYDPSTDTLPESGEVYISLSRLKGEQAVKDLIIYLNDHRQDLHGILSLKDAAALFDDSKFLSTLGLDVNAQTVHPDQIEGLKQFSQGGITVGKNWTVLGMEGAVLKGVKFHKKVKTLKEFMDTDGYYEVDSMLENVLKLQGLTVAEFVELLKKSGKSVKPLAKPISRAQLAYKVFAK